MDDEENPLDKIIGMTQNVTRGANKLQDRNEKIKMAMWLVDMSYKHEKPVKQILEEFKTTLGIIVGDKK